MVIIRIIYALSTWSLDNHLSGWSNTYIFIYVHIYIIFMMISFPLSMFHSFHSLYMFYVLSDVMEFSPKEVDLEYSE